MILLDLSILSAPTKCSNCFFHCISLALTITLFSSLASVHVINVISLFPSVSWLVQLVSDSFTMYLSYTAASGKTYTTDAILSIPKIDIEYPVLSETSEELLKVSLNKYWGPNPNEIGNYCIAAHNYDKENMFNHIIDLKIGDKIYLTDNENGKNEYIVYDIYKTEPENTMPLMQTTEKTEITLITCSDYSSKRIIVKAIK